MGSEKLISGSCDFLYSMLPSLLPGLVISVITAWITVRLSLRRFRAEKWWTKKVESYSAIIESLHHMKEYCLTELGAIEYGRELPPQAREELLAKFKEGIQKVSLAADIGSFVISVEAVKLLKDFQKKYDQIYCGNDFHRDLDERAALIDEYLDSLREIARRDLKIK